MIPECTQGKLDEKICFFSPLIGRVRVCWPVAGREGKKKRVEETEEEKGFLGVEAHCACEFLCKNINEPLPVGRKAVPIISSLGKTLAVKDRETQGQETIRDERGGRSNLPFASSQSYSLCRLSVRFHTDFYVH